MLDSAPTCFLYPVWGIIVMVMRAQIHPKYNKTANVVCSCGNAFTVGSTKDAIHVELCNKCHPFYTGQHRFVDTASRIERFEMKRKAAQPLKQKKEVEATDQQPKSLRDMLQAIKR